MPATSGVKVFAATVDGSYPLTVAVRASVWSVVGVLIPWEGRMVLSFIIIVVILCMYVCVCVCVCVLTTAVLILDLCDCYCSCCFFCVIVKILKIKKK